MTREKDEILGLVGTKTSYYKGNPKRKKLYSLLRDGVAAGSARARVRRVGRFKASIIGRVHSMKRIKPAKSVCDSLKEAHSGSLSLVLDIPGHLYRWLRRRGAVRVLSASILLMPPLLILIMMMLLRMLMLMTPIIRITLPHIRLHWVRRGQLRLFKNPRHLHLPRPRPRCVSHPRQMLRCRSPTAHQSPLCHLLKQLPRIRLHWRHHPHVNARA